MPVDFSDTLVIAVSSRALFDFEADAMLFREGGLAEFSARQIALEKEPLPPGPAFPLVRALLKLNKEGVEGVGQLVEVVIVSSQHPDTGLRVMNSVAHHGLPITRAAFTGGGPTLPYLPAFQVDLLLSRSEQDVQEAVDAGIAAAVMYDLPEDWVINDDDIRIAFDGDAVLFSEDSEALYQREGLAAFQASEAKNAHVPMPDGPMGDLLRGLCRIRSRVAGVMRIALVTARNAPSHERALRTLRAWGVGVDEALFLGGLPKTPFLKGFKPAIFFDDQHRHLGPASVLVPSARVPYRSSGELATQN